MLFRSGEDENARPGIRESAYEIRGRDCYKREMNFLKINKNKQIILWILLLATVFRLFLSWKIPVAYFTEQAYDDQLMYNHAVYISDFKWLGRYSHTTLIKSISSPFFVAI